MIIDAFLYAGEQDLLELRIRTLADRVDVFVPVLCALSHQSETIDYVTDFDRADQLAARLLGAGSSRWLTSVVFPTPYPAGERGGVGSPYYQRIERQHRDGIRDAVLRVTDDPDAIVLVSDVDEIPSPESLDWMDAHLATAHWVQLEQRFHSGYLDWLHPQQPWLGTTVSRLADLEPQAMRDARGQDGRGIGYSYPAAGWHLSWLGTDDDRQQKLDSFSHAELRGRYDPVAGRHLMEHSNGEALRSMTLAEITALPWPAPIRDGSFPIPDSWLDVPFVRTLLQP